MNIYLQSTGKKTSKKYLTVFSRKLLLYLSDYRRGLIISATEKQTEILSTFYRAMICKRGLCCHAVSVCPPSVTFVDHVKTNKHIFEIV